VHHIIKIEDDENRAYDEDNLITLCRIHHEMAEKGVAGAAELLKIIRDNNEISRSSGKISPRVLNRQKI